MKVIIPLYFFSLKVYAETVGWERIHANMQNLQIGTEFAEKSGVKQEEGTQTSRKMLD